MLGLRVSKSLDKNCRVLRKESQAVSDQFLVQLVRIQQAADFIKASLYDNLLGDDNVSSEVVLDVIRRSETGILETNPVWNQEGPQYCTSAFF